MKRYAVPLVALIASLAISPHLLQGQDQDEALTLFEKMQDKLSDATTIQTKVIAHVEFSGSRQPKATRDVEAHFYLQRGERSRITLAETSTVNGKQFKTKTEIITNGKTMAFHWPNFFDPEKINWQEQGIPKDWNASVLGGLVCLDYHSGFQTGTSVKNNNFQAMEDSVRTPRMTVPTGFKLGLSEKIGKHDARVIHYVADRSDRDSERTENTCTLWLNSATLLPLKRENRYTLDHGEAPCDYKVVETFEYIKLDEQIDPRKFEIPTDE